MVVSSELVHGGVGHGLSMGGCSLLEELSFEFASYYVAKALYCVVVHFYMENSLYSILIFFLWFMKSIWEDFSIHC